MDYFDTHYFWLLRKLLVVVGQWPYQNRAERIKKWIMCIVVIIAAVVGQAIRLHLADSTDTIYIEYISEGLVILIVAIRYFTFTINNNKIKALLDNMRSTWKSLSETGEYNVFCECIEEGRLFILYYAITGVSLGGFLIGMLASPLLVYTPLTNDSCPVFAIYLPNRGEGDDKYCYGVLLTICIVVATLAIGLYSTDFMYMAILFHAVAMFQSACYQFEHAFDNCVAREKSSFSRSNVTEKIARAVERHRSSIRFCDDLVAAYEWTNLITLMMGLVSVAIALYWTARMEGSTTQSLFALLFSFAQLLHIFIVVVPAQRMIDTSASIIFKAYNGLWYMGDAKDQNLILLTMQRGLRPSAMVIGRMYEATFENFANEVKVSFSYFTVLMSMK